MFVAWAFFRWCDMAHLKALENSIYAEKLVSAWIVRYSTWSCSILTEQTPTKHKTSEDEQFANEKELTLSTSWSSLENKLTPLQATPSTINNQCWKYSGVNPHNIPPKNYGKPLPVAKFVQCHCPSLRFCKVLASQRALPQCLQIPRHLQNSEHRFFEHIYSCSP